MWIIVALSKDAIKTGEYGGIYIDGKDTITFEISESDRVLLEADNFMSCMWRELDSLLDWGDCDYFDSNKCVRFYNWLIKRLDCEIDSNLFELYSKMKEFAKIAIDKETGISFSF